jgi:DNA-binding Lrp family transcriptional regulator
MPKNDSIQISEDEKKVLEVIQQNSNHNIEHLAKNCGFTTHKVLKIKKRLEKDKIIWGYAALTDYINLDLQHFTVLYKRSNIPLDKEMIKDITTEFLEDKFPELKIKIENVLYVHGEYDFIISFTAPDTLTMKKFCDRLINMHGNFISDYKIHQTIVPIRKYGIKNPIVKEQGKIL